MLSLASLLALSLTAAPMAAVSTPPVRCSIRTANGEPYAPTLASTVRLLSAADVIVRATAGVSESPVPEALASRPVYGEWLEFRVIEVLKGSEVPSTLHIPGFLSDRDDFNPDDVPYIWVRPEGQSGSCFAYVYRRGGEFLLFLKHRAGGYTPYWSIFSPTNEQVRGADDPWVRWVRDRLAHPAALPAASLGA